MDVNNILNRIKENALSEKHGIKQLLSVMGKRILLVFT